MNWHGLKAIYLHEMDRMRRTLFQSLLSPIISTSLYFVVFGSAIGSMLIYILMAIILILRPTGLYGKKLS